MFDAVEAAGEGKWAIGVDSDQYLTASKGQQPHILTSMLKRVDTAVYDYVKAFADGELKPRLVNYDLKSDGVGYSTSGGFVDDIRTRSRRGRQDQERRDQGPDRPGQGQVARGGRADPGLRQAD